MSNFKTHIQETLLPDGTVNRTESVPMFPYPAGPGELLGCEYCYTKHDDWYVMQPLEYGVAGVLLCGNCGHTSIDDKLEVLMLVQMYEMAGHEIDHVCETKLEKMREGLKEMSVNFWSER